MESFFSPLNKCISAIFLSVYRLQPCICEKPQTSSLWEEKSLKSVLAEKHRSTPTVEVKSWAAFNWKRRSKLPNWFVQYCCFHRSLYTEQGAQLSMMTHRSSPMAPARAILRADWTLGCLQGLVATILVSCGQTELFLLSGYSATYIQCQSSPRMDVTALSSYGQEKLARHISTQQIYVLWRVC